MITSVGGMRAISLFQDPSPIPRRHRRRPRSRGVSTIVATMMLLSITVILFGAIFFFINRDLPKRAPNP